MKQEYNQEVFTPEEVEQGLHLELLNCLLNYNKKSDESFKDIHIWTDGYCLCIDWFTNFYDHNLSNSWEYVGERQEVGFWKENPKTHKLKFVPLSEENK